MHKIMRDILGGIGSSFQAIERYAILAAAVWIFVAYMFWLHHVFN